MNSNQNRLSGAGSVEKKTYTVSEIAMLLGVSQRSAYNYCNCTQEFKVIHVGRSIRIHKASFDQWFEQTAP